MEERKHWDEPLEPVYIIVWEKWSADLSSLKEFQLPRWSSIGKPSDTLDQLHLFGDASEKGFGAVCYIRYTFPDGLISFICYGKEPSSPSGAAEHTQVGASSSPFALRLADTAKRELYLHISRLFGVNPKLFYAT